MTSIYAFMMSEIAQKLGTTERLYSLFHQEIQAILALQIFQAHPESGKPSKL